VRHDALDARSVSFSFEYSAPNFPSGCGLDALCTSQSGLSNQSLYCNPFGVYTGLCADMAMRPCTDHENMCGPGSVVMECNMPYLQLGSTMDVAQQVQWICGNMSMPGCTPACTGSKLRVVFTDTVMALRLMLLFQVISRSVRSLLPMPISARACPPCRSAHSGKRYVQLPDSTLCLVECSCRPAWPFPIGRCVPATLRTPLHRCECSSISASQITSSFKEQFPKHLVCLPMLPVPADTSRQVSLLWLASWSAALPFCWRRSCF
jgi:hypothetical protein